MIEKSDIEDNKQFFITCMDENCTNSYAELDVNYGNADMSVFKSILFLPISDSKTSLNEHYYNAICEHKSVQGKLDFNGESGFCNNITSSLPYFYVKVHQLGLSNLGAKLKFWNINNVTVGSKYFHWQSNIIEVRSIFKRQVNENTFHDIFCE